MSARELLKMPPAARARVLALAAADAASVYAEKAQFTDFEALAEDDFERGNEGVMDEDSIGEVFAKRSASRKGSLPEQCSLKVTRRVDGIVLLRSIDVSGRPTMTAELTPRLAKELAALLERGSQTF